MRSCAASRYAGGGAAPERAAPGTAGGGARGAQARAIFDMQREQLDAMADEAREKQREAARVAAEAAAAESKEEKKKKGEFAGSKRKFKRPGPPTGSNQDGSSHRARWD